MKICKICHRPPAKLTEIPSDKFWPTLKDSRTLYICNECADILIDLIPCRICGNVPAKIVEIPAEYFGSQQNVSKFFFICIECIKKKVCPLCNVGLESVIKAGDTESKIELCQLCGGTRKFNYISIVGKIKE